MGAGKNVRKVEPLAIIGRIINQLQNGNQFGDFSNN